MQNNSPAETKSGISAEIQVKSGKIGLKNPHKTRGFGNQTMQGNMITSKPLKFEVYFSTLHRKRT